MGGSCCDGSGVLRGGVCYQDWRSVRGPGQASTGTTGRVQPPPPLPGPGQTVIMSLNSTSHPATLQQHTPQPWAPVSL